MLFPSRAANANALSMSEKERIASRKARFGDSSGNKVQERLARFGAVNEQEKLEKRKQRFGEERRAEIPGVLVKGSSIITSVV